MPPATAAWIAGGGAAALQAAALADVRSLLQADGLGLGGVRLSRGIDWGMQSVVTAGSSGGDRPLGGSSGGRPGDASDGARAAGSATPLDVLCGSVGGAGGGGAPQVRLRPRSVRIYNGGRAPVQIVSIAAVPESRFIGVLDDFGMCRPLCALQRSAAAATAKATHPAAAPLGNGACRAGVEGAEGEALPPAAVVELQPGEAYEVTLVLQPLLRRGQSKDELGLVTQLLLVTLAIPDAATSGGGSSSQAPDGCMPAPGALKAASGGWRYVCAARRAAAFLVGREAAAVASLLRAAAPPFVPASLRALLLTHNDAHVHAPPKQLRLPVKEDAVGGATAAHALGTVCTLARQLEGTAAQQLLPWDENRTSASPTDFLFCRRPLPALRMAAPSRGRPFLCAPRLHAWRVVGCNRALARVAARGRGRAAAAGGVAVGAAHAAAAALGGGAGRARRRVL